MAMLVGQVYHPTFKTSTEEGKEKASFRFSLASRKAFIDDKQKPNLFTKCVAHQPGLAKVLNEHFGKEEDKGKAIVLYGHYDEYTWEPDHSNPDHAQFFKTVQIDKDLMNQGGVILANGSSEQFAIMVPMTQTQRQFVITGFEFADSNSSSSRPARTDKPRGAVVVAGQNVSQSSATTAPEIPASDTENPLT